MGLKGIFGIQLPDSVKRPKISLNYSLTKLLMVGNELKLAIKPMTRHEPKTDVYLLSKYLEKSPSVECVYSLKRPIKILNDIREWK